MTITEIVIFAMTTFAAASRSCGGRKKPKLRNSRSPRRAGLGKAEVGPREGSLRAQFAW
jgi:hypothetical protein